MVENELFGLFCLRSTCCREQANMLRSFGTAVVQSTYLNSPLYQRGLHKVSLKRYSNLMSVA